MTARATYVYRPDHPQANENGFVEKHIAGPRHATDKAPTVFGDLPEYRTAAADKHTGKRIVIGGRRQHREFLRRNNYEEVGNEYVAPRREELNSAERIADIRRSMGDY